MLSSERRGDATRRADGIVDPRDIDRTTNGPSPFDDNDIEWMKFLRTLVPGWSFARKMLSELGESTGLELIEERGQRLRSAEQIDDLLRFIDEAAPDGERKSAIVDDLLIERKKLSDS